MKKDFKNLNTGDLLNPAMQFITPQAQPEEKPQEEKKPEPKAPTKATKKKAEAKETKTKHLHLLFKPSIVEDINKIAFMEKTSLNSLISDVLEAYIGEHKEQIEKYNSVFKN